MNYPVARPVGVPQNPQMFITSQQPSLYMVQPTPAWLKQSFGQQYNQMPISNNSQVEPNLATAVCRPQPLDFVSSSSASSTTSSSNQPQSEPQEVFHDDDLEEFIKQNYKKVASNSPKIGPNTSLDENDFLPTKKRSFKRASLQSLDSASILPVLTSKSTQPAGVIKPKTVVEPKKPIVAPKNSMPKPIESSKPPPKPTTSASTTQGPVVNMTRTAQLRASKLQQQKNSAQVVASAAKSRPIKQTLNASTQLNESNSSRRVSLGTTRNAEKTSANNSTVRSSVGVKPLSSNATKSAFKSTTPARSGIVKP